MLDELPRRTDITLQVDLTTEEYAFYEALRRNALKNLDTPDAPAKNMPMRILAEIMKLRRACCNTRLVMPDAGLPSAKLAVFGDIVAELLATGHKALVFSQFTDHPRHYPGICGETGHRLPVSGRQHPPKETKKRGGCLPGR